MDPFRYRKAYEAMIYYSQLVESRLAQATRPTGSENLDLPAADPPTNVGTTTSGHGSEDAPLPVEEDPDGMEWTPTSVTPAPTESEPPSTTSDDIRFHLPSEGDGAYQVEARGDDALVLSKAHEGVVMDDCIDKLVQDLPDVLNYDAANAFNPSTIEVPKDFGLQMSISINHHLAQVADRKIMEKYRRLLGHRKARTLKVGFDPVELIEKNAVHFPESASARVSTLDNDIHPIFRPENFHGCPDKIYEVLKPALRLCTQLILHRATSPFWLTLAFGERQLCKETSEQYGQECCRIREDVPWSEEHAAQFRAFLDNQVDTLHFLFHRDPLPPDPAYASMGLVSDYKNGLIRKLGGKCHQSKICLHTDFYTTAKRLSLLQYPEPGMVLRFNLFLAACIAHEMAHFIEVSGPHHERPLGRPEVFFYDNMWTESGIAFELKVFGGRLHPISSRVDCSLGLAVLNYPLKELYDKEENILYTIPMDYVAAIQQKETWEQDFEKKDYRVFHVPRTGTRSAEVNGTNLLVWEDEEEADISDHIDGQETSFHRMDDGHIIKNPNVSNKKAGRQPESRRWSPYGRSRTRNLSIGTCVPKKQPEEESDQGESGEAPGTVDMVDGDAMTP